MYILRIEHPVPNYEIWMKVLTDQAIHWESMGVHGYRILKPVDGASFAVVDFDLDTLDQAQDLLAILLEQWSQSKDRVMQNPKGRIFEVVEILGFGEKTTG